MNYQHIARLAELADRLSDKTNLGERVDVSVRFDVIGYEPKTEVTISSWGPGHASGLTIYRIDTDYYPGEYAYTTAEMIQVLEQIEHYGFREQEEAA